MFRQQLAVASYIARRLAPMVARIRSLYSSLVDPVSHLVEDVGSDEQEHAEELNE
jgi:hypothetical protein